MRLNYFGIIFLSVLLFMGILFVPMEESKAQVDSFQIRGADVIVDVFVPGNANYRSDAWNYIKDLNLNLIRVFGAHIGHLPININYDDEWAQNLDAFLTQAETNGVKVLFNAMGSKWGPRDLLGIVPYPSSNPWLGQSWDPWNGQAVVGTSISDAKAMIDKLAGNNSIGHDFITDPRIYGWSISNEQNLGDPVALDWNIQLLDYIRNKGGRAWAAAPWSGNHVYWDAQTYADVLGNHSDLVELHHYGEYEYVNDCNYNATALYEKMKTLFQNMLATSFPADKIFLGEFGCWRGIGSNEGLSNVNFSDQDRINVYTAVISAARDAGLKNVSFHALFNPNGEIPDYGVVKANIDGSGYWDINLANLIRKAYGGEEGNYLNEESYSRYFIDRYPPRHQANIETEPSSSPIPETTPTSIPTPTASPTPTPSPTVTALPETAVTTEVPNSIQYIGIAAALIITSLPILQKRFNHKNRRPKISRKV